MPQSNSHVSILNNGASSSYAPIDDNKIFSKISQQTSSQEREYNQFNYTSFTTLQKQQQQHQLKPDQIKQMSYANTSFDTTLQQQSSYHHQPSSSNLSSNYVVVANEQQSNTSKSDSKQYKDNDDDDEEEDEDEDEEEEEERGGNKVVTDCDYTQSVSLYDVNITMPENVFGLALKHFGNQNGGSNNNSTVYNNSDSVCLTDSSTFLPKLNLQSLCLDDYSSKDFSLHGANAVEMKYLRNYQDVSSYNDISSSANGATFLINSNFYKYPMTGLVASGGKSTTSYDSNELNNCFKPPQQHQQQQQQQQKQQSDPKQQQLNNNEKRENESEKKMDPKESNKSEQQRQTTTTTTTKKKIESSSSGSGSSSEEEEEEEEELWLFKNPKAKAAEKEETKILDIQKLKKLSKLL